MRTIRRTDIIILYTVDEKRIVGSQGIRCGKKKIIIAHDCRRRENVSSGSLHFTAIFA